MIKNFIYGTRDLIRIRYFLALIILGFLQTANCQVISEWRNVGRTGVYNESGLLKKWPEKGPELLMSVTGLAKGFSSVVIGTDKLYLTGNIGDNEVLIALDMKGNKLWETTYGRAWTESFPESRSTPTLDGDRIYVTSGALDAACIHAETGKIIWSVKVNEKFEGVFGDWGKAESPLVLDDKVFFTPAGNKTTMVALNKMTGETIWASASLNDKSSYVSPLLVNHSGNLFIAGVTEKYIFAVSPSDGRMIWKFDYGSLALPPEYRPIHASTPLYFNGCLFVSGGYDHANAMLALSADGTNPTLMWSDTTFDTHMGGCVKVGDYIFGSNWLNNSKGNWACLNWNTGKVMYETNWMTKGSIIAADGMLYCYEEKTGAIALVKATPEKFDLVSSFKVPMGSGPHWSHLVIHNGILYIRHGDALMAFDIKENR
jgi:outer membrane protein assembly factor BamB